MNGGGGLALAAGGLTGITSCAVVVLLLGGRLARWKLSSWPGEVAPRFSYLISLFIWPVTYWAIDMLLHGILSLAGDPHPGAIVLMILLPLCLAGFAMWSLAVCGPRAPIRMPLSLLMFTGIYLLGPSYMVASRFMERLGGVPLPQDPWTMLAGIVPMTVLFPITTFSLSAYDMTLPSPFLATLMVAAVSDLNYRRR